MANAVRASEILKVLESGKVEAKVENDEDCYPKLLHVTIGSELGEPCELYAYYYYQGDQPGYGVSLGQIVVEVDGVRFEAERISDGEHDTFVVEGDVEYDDGLKAADLIAAIEKYVDLPEYRYDYYEFEECSVSDSDLKEAIEEGPAFFAIKDNVVYGYENEDDIPPGFKQIDTETAHQLLVSSRQNLSFDLWG